jgi:hypothetical protein
MKSSRTFSCLIACGLLTLSFLSTLPGTTASAGPITWGSAQNISGDTDVSTNGTLLYAYNFGRASVASTTVNGVTFAPFVVPDFQTSGTVGSVTITESPDYLYGYDVGGSGTTPFSNLSSAYKSLLSSAASAGLPAAITLDLGGLTPGHSYEFQWWANNSSTADNWFVTSASAGNAVSVSANTLGTSGGQGPGVDGGIGQFAIGTFTADNTSYSIAFNGVDFYLPIINGLQLRTVAVPEPSTYAMALAGIACGGFSMWRRWKRA